MKRQAERGLWTRRPALERLEDRTLPGDALGGLFASLLGTLFLPDLLAPAPDRWGEAPARPGARGPGPAGSSKPAPGLSPGWENLTGPPADHAAHEVPVGGASRFPAAEESEEGGRWFAFLRDRPFGEGPPRSPSAGAAFAAAVGAITGLPAGGSTGGGHAVGGGGPVAAASPGRVKPPVQSPQELGQIAFFNSLHAAYEEIHPHGHDGAEHPADGHIAPLAEPAPVLVTAAGEVGVLSSELGQWGPVLSWPLVSVHSHLLPTGKVLLWAYGQDPRRIWDPATGQIETAIPAAPGYNIFCVGHSFLADGRLFVAGGHVQNGWGLPNASIYDPVADTWTRVPDMNAGRWYPTSTTLASGDVLVTSGSMDTNYTNNTLPQVWQPASNTWRDLTTARLSLPLYPSMFVAPNGKVFNAGPAQMARYLDTSGTGAWTNVANNTFGYRDYGTAVMYEPGKVLLVGGGGGSDTGPAPTATAEVIDLNAATPAWRRVAPLATGRRQLNATILPDGTVLVTGGSSAPGFNNQAGAVYTAELWDPATETWTTLASATQYRGYHSTALLLPDGRVLSSGGDSHANAEVFSPPYLFKGARPSVTSAPTEVGYGQDFSVETPDAADVTKVTLVRLSSVTHAFNENQRFNSLAFTVVDGGLNVTAPADANLAPPGDYMLFLVNSSGVPSVANFVRLADTGGVPAAPSALTATAVSTTQVDLAWADNSARETGFKVERRTGPAGGYALIATVGANVRSYQDTGRTPGTQYFYRVRATNSSGDSAYSKVASATTPTGFVAHVNFTTSTGEAYAGYVKDVGRAYAGRGNGLTYGWNADNTANARDRDSTRSPDERYDSLNHMQKPNNPNAYWEIAVPAGTYSVHLVAGDPNHIDSVYRINVEGTRAINGTPTSATRWFETTVVVSVTDGRLTVSNAAGSKNNKVDYIDVTAV